MTFLDFVRGLGTILIIMVVAGGIAYVGDRVGHQVGRKRLTLFNIRPRYTSTIVAVGTGVLIAFVVTLVAILANQQVKTAFFRLNAINAQIADLETQRKALEAKVNRGRLIIPVDTLLVPYIAQLSPTETPAQRLQIIRNYYASSVAYINQTYAPYGLRSFKRKDSADAGMRELAVRPDVEAILGSNEAILLAIVSDRNLYSGDTLDFSVVVTGDKIRFSRGETLGQVPVPKGPPSNVNLAIAQLETVVSIKATKAQLPQYIASRVEVQQLLPDRAQIESIVKRGAGYLLTAYAAQDIFPHNGVVPIVVVFSTQ